MTSFMRYVIVVVCLLHSTSAVAHPHSFISMDARPVVKAQRLVGMQITWEMDELTSAELLLDAASAKESPTVWQSMADELMENTQNQLYFTYMYYDGKPVRLAEKANNYSLTRHGNRAVFTFVMPLAKPLVLAGHTITMSTYEQSYYVDIRYPSEKSVHLPDEIAHLCRIEMKTPKPDPSLLAYAQSLDRDDSPEEDMMLGQRFAQTITLSCR